MRLFSARVTPAGLAEIKTHTDGLGPCKPCILPEQGSVDGSGNLKDINGDGQVNLNDATTQTPTTLIADAHKIAPFVHAHTFRNG